MDDRDRFVRQAAKDLRAPRMRISTAERRVRPVPGLYAIYGNRDVWRALGLGRRPDDRPLYLGKAEASLVGRDLKQHFADGHTGSSTLRRSLAALLRKELRLAAIPRNTERPTDFAWYALSATHDARLTEWMRRRLWIAVWVGPKASRLKTIEDALKFEWLPPLNLDNGSRWQGSIRADRALMADQARRWAKRHETSPET